MAIIPFVGQAYNLSPSVQLDAQNCINWYLTMDSTGKTPSALLPRPSLELWADDSSNFSNRGAIAVNDELYCVVDNKFYIFDFNGNRTEKGTLNTSTGLVSMLVNDNQVFISDGRYGYIYQLNDDDSLTAGDFFVISAASSIVGNPTFTGSGLNDMTTGGVYTGTTDKRYRVVIDSIGTPDTFKWSDDGGQTYIATGVNITGSAQTLNDGVQVTFIHTSGHTANDFWEFNVTIDSAFYVPIKPTYDDNRGIYTRQSTGQWYISEINRFDRVNALDVASAEYFPDDLVAAITLKEEIWLLGRVTAEPWFDVGAQPFPYERRTSLIQNYGCAAPFSAVVSHNFMGIWLSENREGTRLVVGLVNYEVQMLSTEAINAEFRKYSRVDDAIGSTYQYNGHIFYVLTFPTEDRTWVYDLTTKAWHEYRCTLTNEQPAEAPTRQGRFKENWILQYADSILCGDFESGKIYKLTDDIQTDNGQPIEFERTTPHTNDKDLLGRMEIDYLEVDIERGQGLESGQGSDPQYMLQISRDGGYTWGNEKWKSGGASGAYRQRLRWNMLGTARVWTFRLRTTDPVYRAVYGATAYINPEVVQ
jgi:hypothetical protein